MGLGWTPLDLPIDLRAGDGWRKPIDFNDAGDHNRDGTREDPDNPDPLNMSGYTFKAHIRATKLDNTTAPSPGVAGLPTSFLIDVTNLATGRIILSLTPAQTAFLLQPTEGKTTKVLFWDLQVSKTSDANDVRTYYSGDVTVTLDITRP